MHSPNPRECPEGSVPPRRLSGPRAERRVMDEVALFETINWLTVLVKNNPENIFLMLGDLSFVPAAVVACKWQQFKGKSSGNFSPSPRRFCYFFLAAMYHGVNRSAVTRSNNFDLVFVPGTPRSSRKHRPLVFGTLCSSASLTRDSSTRLPLTTTCK